MNQNTFENINIFNPYQKPVNLTLAKKHLKANTVHGKPYQIHKNCPCCGRNYNVKSLDLNSSLKDFYYMGVVYAFIFKFLKFTIFIFLLNFLITGIITLIKIPVIYKCTFNSNCEFQLLKSQYENSLSFTHYFALGNLIFLIISKLLFTFYVTKTEQKIDNQFITVNDYTVYITGLNQNSSEKQIMEILENHSEEHQTVIKVNRIYNIKQYVDLVKQYLEIEKRIKEKELNNNITCQEYHKDIMNKIQIIQEANEIQQSYENQLNDYDTQFTGSAFVTLQTETDMQELIQKINKDKWYCGKFSKYKIRRACQPTDVIWENYGLTRTQKLMRRILTTFIAIILILICFLILWGLSVLQNRMNDNENFWLVWILSIVISIVIILLNYFLKVQLLKFTEWERRPTYTYYEISITWKIAFAQFINTAIVILVANNISDNVPLYQANGIANAIQVIMIYAIFSTCLYTIFDPFYFIRKFKRVSLTKQIKQNPTKVFQYELQQVYENLSFDISFVSYSTLRGISVALFYMPIVPFGMLYTTLEIIFNYLTWKYQFVHRSQVPKELDFEFCKYIIIYFEFTLVIMSLGYIIFDIIIINRVAISSYIMLGISLLQFFILNTNLILKYFKEDLKDHNKNFDEIEHTFPNDYDRMNPITQKKAYKQWWDKINKKNDPDIEIKKKDMSDNKLFETIFNFVQNKYSTGQGENNKYSNGNPFVEQTQNKLKNILNNTNLYKLEDMAREEFKESQVDKFNQQNQIEQPQQAHYEPLQNQEKKDKQFINANFISIIKGVMIKESTFESDQEIENLELKGKVQNDFNLQDSEIIDNNIEQDQQVQGYQKDLMGYVLSDHFINSSKKIIKQLKFFIQCKFVFITMYLHLHQKNNLMMIHYYLIQYLLNHQNLITYLIFILMLINQTSFLKFFQFNQNQKFMYSYLYFIIKFIQITYFL